MPDVERKRDLADAIQLGGSVTAGTVGAAFGGSKLRDAFKEDYPKHFERGVAHAGKLMRRAGVPASRAKTLTEAAIKGKPGFIPIAAATGGAAAVAAGRHYEGHLDRVERRAKRRAQAAAQNQGVTKMHDPFEVSKAKKTKKVKTPAPPAPPAAPAPRPGKLRPAKPSPSAPMQAPGWISSLRHVPPEQRAKHVAAILTGQRHMHTEHGWSNILEHAGRKFAAARAGEVPKLHGRSAALAAGAAGAAAGTALLVRRARRNDAQPSRFDYPSRDAYGTRRS